MDLKQLLKTDQSGDEADHTETKNELDAIQSIDIHDQSQGVENSIAVNIQDPTTSTYFKQEDDSATYNSSKNRRAKSNVNYLELEDYDYGYESLEDVDVEANENSRLSNTKVKPYKPRAKYGSNSKSNHSKKANRSSVDASDSSSLDSLLSEDSDNDDNTTLKSSKKPRKLKISNSSSSLNSIDNNGLSSKKNKGVKVERIPRIPYDPVMIPFGSADVDSLLAYRESDEKQEYLVKFKNKSYHHVEWKDQDYVEANMYLPKKRINKLKNDYLINPAVFDEPFNTIHLEIDRILDEGEISDEEEEDGVGVYLLVKWSGLPYENSTWEKFSKVREIASDLLDGFIARQTAGGITPPVFRKPISDTFKKIEASPYFRNENQLRDYQLEGLNWLLYCWFNNQSCIMADEMGLGKTVQSVSFIYEIFRSHSIAGPFLVVAPLSTIPHWEREFKAWTSLNVVVFHGSSTSRNIIVDNEFFFKGKNGKPLTNTFKFDVIITTYEMIQNAFAQLKPIFWKVAIFDEAHRLKNKNSKVLEFLRSYRIDHRILLTGTPLQNSVSELFSLLNFLDPAKFNNEQEFLDQFGDLKCSTGVAELQDILKPLMLRRFKEDVEKSIPNKEETVIEVELTHIQKTWYRAILEKNFNWLRRGNKGSTGPSLNNVMMELRKVCNHPFLIQGAEEEIMTEHKVSENPQEYANLLIQSSGKLVLLDKLLTKLKPAGHKVLIFSQMTRVLDLLQEYFAHKSYLCERIDGGVKTQDRQIAIDRFSTSPNSFIFLLCTRAGGVGINLTAADTVIIFDSDWNPQNDLQAQARAHRIGQTKPVKIYRLLCANTYELEMFNKANLKLGLDKAVMQRMSGAVSNSGSGSSTGLSKKEVEELLKLGAYGALMNDDESKKFCAEDIDQILERRSTVLHHEGNQKGTAFSKASFTSFENDNTKLDDPQFWDKWAIKANVNPDVLTVQNPLIINEPRIRKKTNRAMSADVKKELGSESEVASLPDKEFEDIEEEEGIDKKVKPWVLAEHLVLERSLMAYGFYHWNKIDSMLPRRSPQLIRSCAYLLVLTFLADNDIVKNAAPSDAPRLEAELRTALAIDQSNYRFPSDDVQSKTVDWVKLLREDKVPYPSASASETFVFRSFMHKAGPGHRQRIDRKAKSLLLRLQTMYRINILMVPSLEDTEAITNYKAPETLTITVPAPWWDTNYDRDILIGIKKHGYMQYKKIRTDPDLSFSKLDFYLNEAEEVEDEDNRLGTAEANLPGATETTGSAKIEVAPYDLQASNHSDITEVSNQAQTRPEAQEQEGKVVWPLGADIGFRIRKLISAFIRNYDRVKKSEKLEIAAELERQSAANPRDDIWTATQQKRFLKGLSSFGIKMSKDAYQNKQWDQFSDLFRLGQRRPEAFNRFAHFIINKCMLVIDSEAGQEIKERNLSAYNFGVKLLDSFNYNNSSDDPDELNNLFKLKVEEFNAERAKRIIKRILLLHGARHELQNSPFMSRLADRMYRLAGFPGWWTRDHYEPFIIAIVRYGINGFDQAVVDPEFSIFADMQAEEWPKETATIRMLESSLTAVSNYEKQHIKPESRLMSTTHSGSNSIYQSPQVRSNLFGKDNIIINNCDNNMNLTILNGNRTNNRWKKALGSKRYLDYLIASTQQLCTANFDDDESSSDEHKSSNSDSSLTSIDIPLTNNKRAKFSHQSNPGKRKQLFRDSLLSIPSKRIYNEPYSPDEIALPRDVHRSDIGNSNLTPLPSPLSSLPSDI